MLGLLAVAAAAAPPAATQETVGQSFENWTIRCETDGPEASGPCFVSQSISLKQGRQRVLSIDIGFAPTNQQAVALLTLPLGISLPPGASLRVDAERERRFAIERCELSGCRGGLIIDNELLGMLLTGEEAIVGFQDAERRPLEVPVRLAGLASGLDALRKQQRN